ncbi:MAG: YqgE/AlgH family protein [Rhodococcus sp.]|nr:YqgE/AlgH family protein [Rhodococcus sp. (in: high G+C Gram-positive bacteria)]
MTHADEPEDTTASADPIVRPGSLLVAATTLLDPTFRRTVVYVIEHNEGGSLGVVLNRPSEQPVHSVLPNWAPLAAHPSTLYSGGPVKDDSALCLATVRPGVDASMMEGVRRIHGRVVLVDLSAEPELIAPMVTGLRFFVGYSGWTLGQLDGELDNDDWLVISALPEDVVSPPQRDMWAAVLRRQPLPLAMLATHPIDVERN